MIVLDTKAAPRFNKPRPLPHAVREKEEPELDRLQNHGVISPVEFADWAAPIVVVSKPDHSIPICGDYSSLSTRQHVSINILYHESQICTPRLLVARSSQSYISVTHTCRCSWMNNQNSMLQLTHTEACTHTIAYRSG